MPINNPFIISTSDIISENEHISVGKVLHMLEEEDLPDLPPGGGISAKYAIFFLHSVIPLGEYFYNAKFLCCRRSFIESIFLILCPDQANSLSVNIQFYHFLIIIFLTQ